LASLQLEFDVDLQRRGRHLKKSICYHNSTSGGPVWTKFDNHMPLTTRRSRLKPEVEFQYGARVFFNTGSVYISSVN